MGGEPGGCGIHETEGWPPPPAKFGSIKTPRGVPGPVGDAGRRQRQQPTWKVLLLQSSAYKGPGGLHKPGALPTASGLLVEGEEIDPSGVKVGMLSPQFSGWPGRNFLGMIHSRKTEFKKEHYRDFPSGPVVVVGGGLVAKSYPILCDPWSGPPGSPVHGASQARTLEWVALSFSRGSFQPRDRTLASCIAGRFFTDCSVGM